MKITKSTLKTIIKEEIENLRKEVTADDLNAIMKARQRGAADFMKNINANQKEEDARIKAAMKEFAGNARLIDAYEDGYEEARIDRMYSMEDDFLEEASKEELAAAIAAAEKRKEATLAKTSESDMDDEEEDNRMAMPGDDDF